MDKFWLFATIVLDVYPFIFLQYLPFRNKLRFRYLTSMLLCAALLVPQFVGFLFLPSDNYYYLYRACLLLSLLLLTIFLIRDAWPKVLFVFALMTPYVITVISVSAFFAHLLHPPGAPPYMASVILRTVLIAITFPPIYWLTKRHLLPVVRMQEDSNWKYATPVPVTFTFLSLFFAQTDYETVGVPLTDLFAHLLIFSGCAFICFFLLRALHQVHEQTVLLERERQSQQLIALQQAQYELIAQNISDAKEARHDLRHHLLAISGLLAAHSYEELGDYVDQYIHSVPKDSDLVICENYAVSSVATYYISLARSHGIEVRFLFQMGQYRGVSDTDLCIILGNCLENSIAGALTAPPESRFIQVRAMCMGESLSITIDNSFDGVVLRRDDAFLSRKSNGTREGIGLASVQSVVEKAGGIIKVAPQDNLFQVSVLLP